MAETVQPWSVCCAVPMPEKFIVHLSAVIREAGPAQNMFVYVRSWRFSKGVGHFRRIFDKEVCIAHKPVLVSEN